MKIISAKAIPFELVLSEPFAISNETVDRTDNVFFRIETDKGITGWGCAAPDTVTSETRDSVLTAFEKYFSPVLIGEDPLRYNHLNEHIEKSVEGNMSAKAGVNIALYDLLGKAANLPLYKLLGGYKDKIETSVTLGINPTDVMVEKAKEWVSRGFHCLKIKCGINADQDIDTVLAIREAVGPAIKLRLDANEGYTVEEALHVVSTIEIRGADIEFLEQPTKALYLYALKEVTSRCKVPIMADETALNMRDSLRLIKMEIADMINIKLMKLGGITNADKVNHYAELADIPVMIGCMNESMAAMSAGVHFACANKNVTYADLDSTLDLTNDPAKGGARFEDGFVIPSEEPGLGIKIDL